MRETRHIVLTGASRGLGLAMARGFAERGHRLSGCSRRPESVRWLRDEFGDPHRFDVLDVADGKQVAHWADQVLADGGPPDLLINNAALINENAPLWQVPPDQFARVVDVNVKGVYHIIRYFVPAMISRGGGVIVNFSSGWGRSTSPEVATYCATKWAVEGLTRALADELPDAMAAVPLNPGVIHTEMLESCFGADAAAYPEPAQWATRAVPFLLGLGPSDNGRPLTVPS